MDEILIKIWEFVSNPIIYPLLAATTVSIITGFLTYSLALRRFHREKQYQNKLDRYLKIVEKMRGFVEGVDNPNDRTDFVNSYRTIWLYGSADVIKLITKFLKIALMKKENLPKDEKEKEKLKNEMKDYLKEAVLKMRKDLKASGKLKKDDFDIYV